MTFVQRMESEVVNDSSSYHVFFLTTFHFGSKRLKQPCIGLASFIIGSSEPPLALPPVTAEVSICTKSQTSYSIALFLVRAFWSKEKFSPALSVACFRGKIGLRAVWCSVGSGCALYVAGMGNGSVWSTAV